MLLGKTNYTDNERFKVRKCAAGNGNIWAARKFDIGESTVRTFKKGYFKEICERSAVDSEIVLSRNSPFFQENGQTTSVGKLKFKSSGLFKRVAI